MSTHIVVNIPDVFVKSSNQGVLAFMKDAEEYSKFASYFDDESDTSNFTIPFTKLMKVSPRDYINYCIAAWAANVAAGEDALSEAEFCKLNGNMPIGFFNSKIKGSIK